MSKHLHFSGRPKSGDLPKADATVPSNVPASDDVPDVDLEYELEPTDGQRAVLAAIATGGTSPEYVESLALRLDGPLDENALDEALAALVARHDALRASFGADGRMRIRRDARVPLRRFDWRGEPQPEREPAVVRHLAHARQLSFDLRRGPLLRVELHRLEATAYLLAIDAHTLVCDGWSLGVIARDLGWLYRPGFGATPLSPPTPWIEYVQATRDRHDESEDADDVGYWAQRWAAPPPALALPTDPAGHRPAPERLQRTLSPTIVAELRRVAVLHDAGLFAAMLAVFRQLLGEIAGCEDPVIGIPVTGQIAWEMPELVGQCGDLLPVFGRIDRAAGFATLVEQTQAAVREAVDHQLCGLSRQAAAGLGAPGTLAVLFDLDQPLDGASLGFDGLQARAQPRPPRLAGAQIALGCRLASDGLRIDCDYDANQFARGTVTGWLDRYETLLQVAAGQPRIAELHG